MDAHRYWRLTAISNGGAAVTTTLGAFELRVSVGGANIATTGNGTPSSSAVSGVHPASNAFDGNSATVWAGSGPAIDAWLQWDFGSGNAQTIAEAALGISTGGGEYNFTVAVTGGTIQCSDNGSTWTTKLTFSGIPGVAGTYPYALPIAISGNAAATLPSLASTAYSGGTSAVNLPTMGSASYSGVAVNAALPSISASALGHDSTGEQAADITLPSLSATFAGGGNASVTLPVFTATASGTVTSLATASISLPTLTATAGATVSGTASANISLPAFNAKSYAGALCSITVGSLTAQAIGTTSSIGRSQITLPLFQAVAVATAQNHGSVQITLPSLSMQSGGNGAAVSLPSLSLTAIGTATITATYEAYAINLNHTPRPNEQTVDEATHYTNFPFTHVVRYQNSYYGANSTGLYLLEGTTDDGTPIPWAFETAMTDFKKPNLKTLASAYFSGRFGPASTIKLKVGERAPISHSFSTPRGQLAQNHRQVFGKGSKARHYALAASGTGTVELDGIECEVHQLTRRI